MASASCVIRRGWFAGTLSRRPKPPIETKDSWRLTPSAWRPRITRATIANWRARALLAAKASPMAPLTASYAPIARGVTRVYSLSSACVRACCTRVRMARFTVGKP